MMKKHLVPLFLSGLVVGAAAAAAIPSLAQNADGTRAPMTRPFRAAFAHGPMGIDPLFLPVRQAGGYLDDRAELLGLSPDDLLVLMAQSKKPQEILDAAGLDAEALKTRLTEQRAARMADLKTRLNALVTSGRITQDQADAFVNRLTTPPEHPLKHGFRGHRPGAPEPPPASS